MRRSPSRRAFAALGLSLVAGCVSLSDGDSSNDGPPNDVGRDRSTCSQSLESPDPYPDIRVDSDDVPADADVSVCVWPIEPFTDDSPAKIAFELANESDSSAEFGFGVTPPWGGVRADPRSGPEGLTLVPDDRTHVVPAEEIVPAEPTDGCWRAQSSISVNEVRLAETIDSGATVREEYTVLAGRLGKCLAPGTYRSERNAYDPVGEPWGIEITLSE